MRAVVAALLLLVAAPCARSADLDDRIQYPSWLAHSYVDIGVGSIHYPFSTEQLQPGFTAASVDTPHLAARVVIGHHVSRALAVQISYMRPFEWVKYRKVNGADDHSVWMNVGALTARGTMPLTGPLSIEGEAGLAVVTRSGFKVGDVFAVSDESYPTVLLGTGLRYRLADSWDVDVHAAYVPGRPGINQPRNLLVTGGFSYTLQSMDAGHVREIATGSAVFPARLVQAGYATDAFGLGVNHFVTRTVPIFWDGLVNARSGVSVRYQQNVFHTRRFFALDLGASAGRWETARDRETFQTASVFPVLRLIPLHLHAADVYFAYSVAGPTVISKLMLDGEDTGRHFTFQDSMAIGFDVGRARHWNMELRITHFSNGNLFSRNAGITIPLCFNAGYAF